MSKALRAAADEARERMRNFMHFSQRAIEQLDQGMPAPAPADVKAYRELTLSSLRKLTKFPRAVIPLRNIGYDNDHKEGPLADLARKATVALSLGLIDPGHLISLIVALQDVRELEPEPPRARPSKAVRLPPATITRMLPERAGGMTTGELFGERQ